MDHQFLDNNFSVEGELEDETTGEDTSMEGSSILQQFTP